MPVWDDYVGDALFESVESVRAQGFPARVILVDNDSAVAIPELEGVKTVQTPHRLSLGGARNFGLACVDTPYVVFWDADDVMLPDTLRRLHARISAAPDVVLCAASIVDLETMTTHRWPRRWIYPLTRWRRLFAWANCGWSLFPTGGSTMIRTEAARTADGFADSDGAAEWVMGVSLAFRGRVHLCSWAGRLYRQRSGSLWEQNRSRRALRAHARLVRDRVRNDAAIPRWAKASLPLIFATQHLAVSVVHPAITLARRRLRSRVAPGESSVDP